MIQAIPGEYRHDLGSNLDVLYGICCFGAGGWPQILPLEDGLDGLSSTDCQRHAQNLISIVNRSRPLTIQLIYLYQIIWTQLCMFYV